jgi:hypothetical protein
MNKEKQAEKDLDNASKLLALVQEAGEQTVLDVLRGIGYKVEPPVKPKTAEERIADLEAELAQIKEANLRKTIRDFGREQHRPLKPSWPTPSTTPYNPLYRPHRITCADSNAQGLLDFLIELSK